MTRFNFLLPLFWVASLFAQTVDLSDREKVKYINENFYEIYSDNLAEALRLTQWAAETARKNRWQHDEAYALLGWGVVSYLAGDYRNALPRYLEALELFEKLNDNKGITRVCNELGVFYYKMKDTVNCFQILDRAEQLARQHNDLESLGTNLGHRGAFLSREKKFSLAEPYFLEVYEIRKKTNDSVGMGYVLLDLAEMAANRKNLKEALAHIDHSTEIRQRIHDKYGLAVNAVTRGETLQAFGHQQEAIQWLENGLRLAQEVGFTDLVHATYYQLAQLNHQAGNDRKAFEHLMNYGVVKDSLFNLEKIKAVNEIQTRYETEKKELLLAQQQLALQQNRYLIIALVILLLMLTALIFLWRNRVELKQRAARTQQQKELQEKLTEAVITFQEAERTRFAKDLHDGLGQMISSVRLYVNQSGEGWSTRATSLLDDMHREIRNIAFALLPHTLVNDGLGSALRELAGRISQSGRVQVEVDVNGTCRLPDKIEVSVYRICQEWVNNVMKYADSSTIRILLIQDVDCFTLIIEDDGKGFNPAILNSAEGNGWRNIQSRIALHSGTVRVESSPAKKGSILIAELPLLQSSHQKVAQA
jgi:signal transduction histidine kinase